MNDRTRWNQSQPAADRYRDQQGGWDNPRQAEQAQNWSGQQGGWNDDDYRSSGNLRHRDWGSAYGADQPHQREWNSGAARQGGTGFATGKTYGAGSYSQGGYGHDDGRADWSRGNFAGGTGSYGRPTQDDIAGRGARELGGQDWNRRDNFRNPGSQSFAAGYGMIDGANYDRSSAGYSGGYAGNPTFGRGYGPDYGRDEGRGFFARAGDEVASWFGDDDAARRRERDRQDQDGWRGESRTESHRGRGPTDYTRSDERIREDANDRLTDDHHVDARRITVTVDKGEVTLAGSVTSREDKRRAEDLVDRISGVRHVQNNLRIAEKDHDRTETSGWGSGSAGKSAASTSSTATGTSAATTPKTSG